MSVFSLQYLYLPMQKIKSSQPLADRMRPETFAEFFGQHDIVAEGKLLRNLVRQQELRSCIFWGPPGVGKTTLAQIVARESSARLVVLSAVESGKAALMSVVKDAEQALARGEKTILFVDEIHRWNKAQQDALLPFVEKGIVTLIGATTENPSFEIIGALLSRCRVFILHPLSTDDIVHILERAIGDNDRGYGAWQLSIDRDVIEFLAHMSGGDARTALNALELAVTSKIDKKTSTVFVSRGDVEEALQRTHLIFDKNGEEFYNVISALHKSMRGSDANAALYWLARMLEGGADPLYVARRVVRFASEDIGMANSEALVQAMAAFEACHVLGMPECTVHLAQAVVYCAKSKKSNRLYTAYAKAAADAKRTSHLGVPLHIRNAPTTFMKDIGYGKGYKYPPDMVNRTGNSGTHEPIDQTYLPDELLGVNYFTS